MSLDGCCLFLSVSDLKQRTILSYFKHLSKKRRRQRDAKCSGRGNKILFSLICRNKKIDVSMMYRTFVDTDGCRASNKFIETNENEK